MGMSRISRSQVSRLCEEIDDKVKAFLGRPLEDDWPYLWIDATYVKVRESGRFVSAAVIVAVAVNSDRRREVLGMDIGPSEAENFWTAFLRQLARRGLRAVKLVISDSHEGIKAATAKVLHASWQRCRVHFIAQRARPCRPSGSSRRRSLHRHSLRPGRCRGREQAMARGRRSVASQSGEARCLDG
jgi:transposase-like protein